MTKTYTLSATGQIVEVNVLETPFGRNATVGARWEPGPFPPSFKFVPPQIGATCIPNAPYDDAVMPASNGPNSGEGSLYFNEGSKQLMVWANQQWGQVGNTTFIEKSTDFDMNQAIYPGVFYLLNGAQNLPSTGNLASHLLAEIFTYYGFIYQRVIGAYDDTHTYTRVGGPYAGPGTMSWQQWVQFSGVYVT
jgi:hypothetical protein